MNQWTTESGLRSNNLTSIHQSNDGYLWITSYNGIHKFDGVKFKVFDKNNVSVLNTSAVFTEYETENKVLWFATEASGLIGHSKGAFFKLPNSDSLPKAILTSAVDPEGTVWIGTNNRGLYSITKDSLITKHSELPEISINNININNNGDVYVATDGDGIYIIEDEKTTHLTVKNGLLSNVVNNIYFQDDKVLIGSINGLNVWSDDTLQELRSFNGLEVNQIAIDEFATIWAATEQGLAKYNESHHVFELYSVAEGLPGKQVSGLLFDNEGSLWLTTKKAGLIRFKKGNVNNITAKDGLSSGRVNVILKKNETYYIGTDDGVINVLDDKKFTEINLGSKFHHAGIRDFLFQKNGDWWVASYEGVMRMSRGKTTMYNTENGLPANEIRRIFEDSKGNIWLGSRVAGLIKFNQIEGGTHEVFDKKRGLDSDYVMSIEEDNAGNIIVGTKAGGLTVINPENQVSTFHIKEDDTGILIFNIYIDEHNMIWVCTNIGLYVFENEKFRKIDLDKQLESETFFDIIDDRLGNYWLTSNIGVVKLNQNELAQFLLNKQSHTIKTDLYGKDNGMVNNECTGATRSFYDEKTAQIWIPTFGGVAIIDPTINLHNSKIPPVSITEFTIDDKSLDLNVNDLKIKSRAFRYRFDFTSLSFLTPSKVRFMYKLEGFDENWIGPIPERSVQYTNLPARKFTFKVKGTNSEGVWNDKIDSYSFEIVPFFYNTRTFSALILFFIALVLFGIYKWRIREITKRNDVLRKMNNELDRFVYSSSHDLRAPLASIMSLVSLYHEQESTTEEKDEYVTLIEQSAHKMDIFIHDIIDYSRNKNKSLDIEKIDLLALINESFENIKYLNIDVDIDFSVNISGGDHINTDSRRLKVILSNLIGNAINYSDRNKEKSFVKVNVTIDEKMASFEVKDNGIGIPESDILNIFSMFYRAETGTKGSGLGLYIVKEALEKLGGNINVESELGKWTTFSFSLSNQILEDTLYSDA